MTQYSRILVGVSLEFRDGPASAAVAADCRNAAERAITLAKRERAQLTFAHTLAVSAGAREWLQAAEERVAAAVEESSRRELQGLVDLATARGVTADYEFLFGKPWDELAEEVQRGGFDLIVVGSRQQRGLRRTLFGSTASRVMLRAPCPVLVVQGRSDCDFRRIVIATDLSATGISVIRHGMRIADELGCEAEVVHGVDNWYEDQWHRAGFAREVVEQEHEQEKANARSKLESVLVELAVERRVPVPKVRVETGVYDVIRRAADDGDTDLLVMGVVGRSGFERLWVGDTAERVLPELPCSLLAVRLAEAVPS